MGTQKGVVLVGEIGLIVMLLSSLLLGQRVSGAIDCSTVTILISACSSFVTYGSPDPYPGSPCCDAVQSLTNIADTSDNKRSMCRCLMGLITTYNPNAVAIGTLPGFCGVSLGFTIHPDTDCEIIA